MDVLEFFHFQLPYTSSSIPLHFGGQYCTFFLECMYLITSVTSYFAFFILKESAFTFLFNECSNYFPLLRDVFFPLQSESSVIYKLVPSSHEPSLMKQ